MHYDPFAARNLVPAFALIGLLVVMTEEAPDTGSVAIGLFCLVASCVLSLFAAARPKTSTGSRPARTPGSEGRRGPAEASPARSGNARKTEDGIEAHPAIFATVSGRASAGPRAR